MAFPFHPAVCLFPSGIGETTREASASSALAPVRPTSIGVVVFRTHKNERAEAVLDIEGVWRCRKLPVLDRVLNALYEPRRNVEDDSPFGHPELFRVASWLKGEARIPN